MLIDAGKSTDAEQRKYISSFVALNALGHTDKITLTVSNSSAKDRTQFGKLEE